jgi:FlaA1/EpsC-like NDP-sugar epimerase
MQIKLPGGLAPGLSMKLNMVVDLAWVLASVLLAVLWKGQSTANSPELVWFGIAATAVWLVTSTALRQYDPHADRDTMDEVALVSVLVLAVTTVLAAVSFAVPAEAHLPGVPEFLLLVWPVVMALRLFVFRPIARKEGPLDEVLIIGTGPMGRITAEDRWPRTVARCCRYWAGSRAPPAQSRRWCRSVGRAGARSGPSRRC